MNNPFKNKYIRYAIGIPAFCIGISLWIIEPDHVLKWWETIFWIINAVAWTAAGLALLDVPTVNNTVINLNLNKTND